MMADSNENSTIKASKEFLRESLAAEQRVLVEQLKLSTQSICHNSTKGTVTEQHFIKFLSRYLPRRYEVSSGIVIDHTGQTSDQIDIIIYDPQYTPTLLDQNGHHYVPAEAVYGILEVKPTINKDYLLYAADKAESVRKLDRTSGEFLHIGGQSKKEPFDILAGIVAPRVEWASGVDSESFCQNVHQLSKDKNRILNCGIALADKSFDYFVDKEGLNFSPNSENSLAYFIFRLLSKLQIMGTAPAADWRKYAETISN